MLTLSGVTIRVVFCRHRLRFCLTKTESWFFIQLGEGKLLVEFTMIRTRKHFSIPLILSLELPRYESGSLSTVVLTGRSGHFLSRNSSSGFTRSFSACFSHANSFSSQLEPSPILLRICSLNFPGLFIFWLRTFI